MREPLLQFWYRIKSRFHRDELDSELAAELRAHAEFLEEEILATGVSRDEARRIVSTRLGNITQIREATREHWSFRWVESLAQDTRYAFRFLRRSPGFTVVAILSLALGIGANATVFSVVDKLMFSAPAHVTDADNLLIVNVRRDYEHLQKPLFTGMARTAEFFALQAQAKSFSDIALTTTANRQILGRGPLAPRIKEALVTTNFFAILGAKPHRGRFLVASDESTAQSTHAAVISYSLWKKHFGGADSALGKQFISSDLHFVVVGVAPPEFTGAGIDAVDVWASLFAAGRERMGSDWAENGGWPRVLVRLRDGVSRVAAETEATTILRRLPDEKDIDPAKETVALGSIIEARGPGDQSSAVKVSSRLILASALVLLAACANLANLLLMRALTRRRELALRLAVGISRLRLASQMMLESLIVALGGAVIALCSARWSGDSLRKLAFPELQWETGTVNMRVFAFAAICGALVAFLATMAPAVRMTRADVGRELRSNGSQLSNSTGRLRQALMVLQVALSVLLIVGAAAFSSSLRQAYAFDMGIDVEKLVTVRFSFEADTLNETTRLAMLEEAVNRMRKIPGVEMATVAASLPLTGWTNTGFFITERELPKGAYATIWHVTPALQAAAGFRLVRGRLITPEDASSSTVASILVSESGAKQLWPDTDPIGRCVKFGKNAPCVQVIGVVRDLRRRSLHDTAGVVFLSATNRTRLSSFDGYVVVRLSDASAQARVIGAGRKALVNVRNDLSSIEIQPLATALEPDYRPLRLGAYSFSSFALLAIVLAAIGLYGILAFGVAQRTNEFGIRAALGAQARDLVLSVIREGMTVVAVGVALGLAASWYASTAISAFLFHANARDALPYVFAACALGVVALAASVVPAWRASRVDPAIALRAE